MHYGINSRLFSMQQQQPGQRRRCAGCCLSHYCHCAMLSCHVISPILHTLTFYGVSTAEYFPLSFLFPRLAGAGAECLHPSDSSHTATAPPQHCPSGHAAETRRQQSLITIIATQVLAQQTRRAPQLFSVYHHHNIQMINKSQAVTWIWYSWSYNKTLALVTELDINNQPPLCGLSLYKQCSRDSTVTEVMYLISV